MKEILKILIILFIYFFLTYEINAQVPFSLSNSYHLIPSNNSALLNSENLYLIFPDSSVNNFVSLKYQMSKLNFSELAISSVLFGKQVFDDYYLSSGAGYFGFDLMNELNVNLALSRNFGNVGLGVNAQYNRIYFKDFSNENLFIFDLFGKIRFSQVDFGFLLNNINRAHFSNYDKTIPQRAVFSVGFPIFDKVKNDFGAVLLLDYSNAFFYSIKYEPFDWFAMNAIYYSDPQEITAGLSLSPINQLSLNFYTDYNPIFGYDLRFSSTWEF
jgi:hypothetical protein